MLSPFRPQNVPVDPSKHLPALHEQKKGESRHRSRISLYRWLGQQNGEERRVTFKTEEDEDKDQSKDAKDGMETIIQGLLEPRVSPAETNEYER